MIAGFHARPCGLAAVMIGRSGKTEAVNQKAGVKRRAAARARASLVEPFHARARRSAPHQWTKANRNEISEFVVTLVVTRPIPSDVITVTT